MITDWGEAWQEVINAIRFYGSYRETDAMKSLNPLTAQAVKKMGFMNLCQSENPIADRVHFQRIYERMLMEIKKNIQLSQGAQHTKKQMIEKNMQAKEQIEVKEFVDDVKEVKHNSLSHYSQSIINDFYIAMGKA